MRWQENQCESICIAFYTITYVLVGILGPLYPRYVLLVAMGFNVSSLGVTDHGLSAGIILPRVGIETI